MAFQFTQKQIPSKKPILSKYPHAEVKAIALENFKNNPTPYVYSFFYHVFRMQYVVWCVMSTSPKPKGRVRYVINMRKFR